MSQHELRTSKHSADATAESSETVKSLQRDNKDDDTQHVVHNNHDNNHEEEEENEEDEQLADDLMRTKVDDHFDTSQPIPSSSAPSTPELSSKLINSSSSSSSSSSSTDPDKSSSSSQLAATTTKTITSGSDAVPPISMPPVPSTAVSFKTPTTTSGEQDGDSDNSNPSSSSSSSSSLSSSGVSSFSDVRVAVVGNVDSGKSTLIGVLTSGQLDNGRGLARSKVFVHNHEQQNGRTSCISQHIMGFDSQLQPVHQPIAASATAAQKNKSWKDVVSNSRSVITFIDLAGHEKYLKTTIAGLTGCYPDYAFVIINSLAGISKMTKEHLGVVIALDIPLICIVTKIDMVPDNVKERTKTQMDRILKSPGAKKLPIHVRNIEDIDTALQTPSNRVCPILYVSSVTGVGLDLLHNLLSRLRSRRDWETAVSMKPEFSIDDTFAVTGVGIVISGTVRQGLITPNTTMLLGPVQEGVHSTWKEVMVRTIHCKRCPVESVQAGNSCALSLRAVKRKDGDFLKRQFLRRGMVLVDPSLNPSATRMFDAEVLVLHHPTTIKLGYQAVIHAGIIRQTATIVHISQECLRTGDRALVRFRFLLKDEYVHIGTTFIFREGSTKGIGRIKSTTFTQQDYDQAAHAMDERKSRHHQQIAAAAAAAVAAASTDPTAATSDAAAAATSTTTSATVTATTASSTTAAPTGTTSTSSISASSHATKSVSHHKKG